ncbi:MAG: radical SAM protein [Mesorhizobium sp.]|uniref:radical SAM protein n=1 Tax=unclassified Mesorhizobium TaxID=325217 RepID=UPI000FCC6B6F|nr:MULTISPECIES: radical SAM protein [unclassified Mesorhizobium]MCT2575698.1 radical SAM protein [Mesorhizobium sp. P13.3]MDF3165368.1 radical SAM protein [Mesorhizobium sp. P16.1]MDF3177002.1 radical SAM protein [Mesorhizobium sp. P17.1]MDF3182280.1 radical SAM protein [Mesorhizobium sp. ICCV3110.1]RUV24879.1 radical SAM protein [Mesorhizobium sp. M1A.F.Ca.IN.022.04.1.1]
MADKNILLIEPGYKNKYPPLGLMKIAQYHGPRGKKDRVRFIKGEDRSVLSQAWDRIYVTTLFSFEYPKIAETVDFALEVANGQADKVFVGGIAASLMHGRFQQERRWHGVRFIKGLLASPPAVALQLDEFSEELYSDDILGQPIEDLVPDYDILDQIDYKYPVQDAYFAYTSRGCIRKCHFCGVPKLEGPQRDTESLTSLVRAIDDLYGPKKDLTLMDNNVVASPRFKDIIAEIRDLGFTPGAKLHRPGRVPVQRRVDFNQGVDARILCKDPMYLRELSTICLKPLRIAFDHLGVKKPYEQAIRYAAEYGLTELSNYMLYNFHDGPADLFERMRLNVALNEELNVRIWSFPMRYQPTDRPDRGHVGEKWSRYQLRSMQIILQATHGIVSGAPTFFRRAFGDTFEDYERILLLPHDFIFNRDWFERVDPDERLASYRAEFDKLDGYERAELIELLSSCDPREIAGLSERATTPALKRVLRFYVPLPKEELFEIWAKQKDLPRSEIAKEMDIAEDERVEDAGLDHEEEPNPPGRKNKPRERIAA